jgi:FMN-dependent NADH-azoreductase
LTSEFVQSWKIAHQNGTVIDRDLAAAPPPPIDAGWIAAAYTPREALTVEQKQTLALSDDLITELQSADEYVIGVAMHNFSVPAVLRLWIDQIARKGLTFAYSENGPQGLLRGKKATVVVASGGVYAPGTPAATMNHIEPYLKTILGFVGVTDVKFIAAGGTAALMSGTTDRSKFLKPVLEEVRAAAA